MTLTKRKFFKRKNRTKIYNVYTTAIDRACELAERYQNKVTILRSRKNDFQTGSHIWSLLDRAEKEFTSTFEHYAYLRCANLKCSAFTVNLTEYDELVQDIQKLTNAIGNISALLEVIDYLERNELKVRAK